MFYVRLLHHLEELTRVGGKALDVAALAFGIDGVESERAFPGAGQTRNNRQSIARNFDVNILQIVLPRSVHGDAVEHIRGLSSGGVFLFSHDWEEATIAACRGARGAGGMRADVETFADSDVSGEAAGGSGEAASSSFR